ncbi:unnamed protein product [Ectocarpus sp. 6 AP-2014]
MATTHPTASVYGSQISTSGDLCTRSVSGRNKIGVYTPGANSRHLCYVADAVDTSVTECSRVTNSSSGGVGKISIAALEHDSGGLVYTFASEPLSTVISAGTNNATFGHIGLSFDSDECAIYFGKDRTFRIMYVGTEPERLVFQCVDSVSGGYVTKFSCSKAII